jgi:tetratricopeptide (TPR) repeat protein
MAELRTCPEGHQWEAAPDESLSGGMDAGCPVCSELYEDPPLPPGQHPAILALQAFIESVPVCPGTHQEAATLAAGDCRESDGPGLEPAKVLPNSAGYEIRSELGRGGMGVVYQAWHVPLKRIVALKVIAAGRLAGAESLRRFRAEAEAAARLQHPYIVQIHEVGKADGVPFYSMEYVSGGSLDQRMRRTPYSFREAAEIVEKLAAAVQSAHAAGIVHRDLKPSNVLLTVDGQPKITDFGLAKQLDRVQEADLQTRTGAILGTPSYMAPEQAAGQGRAIGPATDVYSLGAILYEVLTGRPPFRGADYLQTLEQVRTREPLSPARLQPGIPQDLTTICLKCLEKAPANRYASAQELAADLQRFLAGEPIHARPAGKLERGLKWVRRKPWQTAVVATALVGSAAFAGSIAWHERLFQKEARRADDSETAARAQKLRAFTSFQKGHETLDRLLTSVEEDDLRARDPRTFHLQREVAAAALKYYSDVIRDADDSDPELRINKARLLTYSAQSRRFLSQTSAALDDNRQAHAIIESLLVEHPSDTDYRAELADCIYHEAELLQLSAPPASAEASFLQALQLDEINLRADPNLVRALRNRGSCYWRLSALYESSNQRAQAADSAAAAVDPWSRLLDIDPGNGFYRTRVGLMLKETARLNLARGHQEEAETAIREAVAILNPMLEPFPMELESLWGPIWLAEVYREWGLLVMARQPRLAVEKYSKAIEIIDKVLAREPQLLHGRVIQSQLYTYRALTRENLGDHAATIYDREQSCAFADGMHHTICRADFAYCLARIGEHRRASAEANDVAVLGDLTPLWRATLGRAFAVCVSDAQRDGSLSQHEHSLLQERYGRQAVEQLRRCREAGYFAEEAKRQELHIDPSFEPIRNRPDFQQFVREVDGGQPRAGS